MCVYITPLEIVFIEEPNFKPSTAKCHCFPKQKPNFFLNFNAKENCYPFSHSHIRGVADVYRIQRTIPTSPRAAEFTFHASPCGRVLPYNSNRVSQTKNSAAAFCIHLRAGTDSCFCPCPSSLSSVSLKLRSLCEF